MNTIPENCGACGKRLFDAVKFCPYCGKSAIVAGLAEAVDAPGDVKVTGHTPASSAIAAATKPDAAPAQPVVPVAVKPKPETSAKPVDAPAKLAAERSVLPPVVAAQVVPKPAMAAPAAVITKSAPKSTPSPTWLGKISIVLVILLVFGVGFDFVYKSSQKESPCDLALTQAAAMLASGDAGGARSQALLASAACSGEARTKASELQTTANKALVLQARCEGNLRSVASKMGNHYLQSASNMLDKLDAACTGSAQGMALRQQIESGKTAARTAEAEVRNHLANGDISAARTGLAQIPMLNREHPDLGLLRAEVQAGIQVEPAPAIANTPVPGSTPNVAVATASSPTKIVFGPSVNPSAEPLNARPAANPQAELVLSFLQDAENAMNQLKFDAAKTFVESARRIDPRNPQVAVLARKIKERELDYIKKEMTIN